RRDRKGAGHHSCRAASRAGPVERAPPPVGESWQFRASGSDPARARAARGPGYARLRTPLSSNTIDGGLVGRVAGRVSTRVDGLDGRRPCAYRGLTTDDPRV